MVNRNMLEKIKTQSERDRKRRQNQLIVGIVMIGILVLSTAGFSLLSSDNSGSGGSDSSGTVTENGYSFTNYQGQWALNYGGTEILFNYLPSEVVDVLIEGEFDASSYLGSTLYFVGDGGAARNKILQVLGSYASKYQNACLEGYSCEADLPSKNCNDNLIVFDTGTFIEGGERIYEDIDLGETKIIRQDNCVFIGGDQLRSVEAFLYKTLGVIN